MPVERVKITHPATGATSEVRAAAAPAWAGSGWVLVDEVPKPKASRRRRAGPATRAIDSRPPTAGDQDDSDAGSSTNHRLKE